MKQVVTIVKPPADDQERLQKIADILSDGVYGYLKANGLLKGTTPRADEIMAITKPKDEGNAH